MIKTHIHYPLRFFCLLMSLLFTSPKSTIGMVPLSLERLIMVTKVLFSFLIKNRYIFNVKQYSQKSSLERFLTYLWTSSYYLVLTVFKKSKPLLSNLVAYLRRKCFPENMTGKSFHSGDKTDRPHARRS